MICCYTNYGPSPLWTLITCSCAWSRPMDFNETEFLLNANSPLSSSCHMVGWLCSSWYMCAHAGRSHVFYMQRSRCTSFPIRQGAIASSVHVCLAGVGAHWWFASYTAALVHGIFSFISSNTSMCFIRLRFPVILTRLRWAWVVSNPFLNASLTASISVDNCRWRSGFCSWNAYIHKLNKSCKDSWWASRSLLWCLLLSVELQLFYSTDQLLSMSRPDHYYLQSLQDIARYIVLHVCEMGQD